jgi:hypothetical protein
MGKVFSCGRELLLAKRATFQGCGIMGSHRKFAFLMPRPRVLAHRWDTLFPPVIIPQAGGIP